MPLVFDHRLDTKRTALFLAAIIESESVHHVVNESVRMKRIAGADGVKKQHAQLSFIASHKIKRCHPVVAGLMEWRSVLLERHFLNCS